jgi:diacylglycerol kinase family enzyme
MRAGAGDRTGANRPIRFERQAAMPTLLPRPSPLRRLAAAVALLLALAVAVLAVVAVATDPLRLVVTVALLAVAAVAVWYAVSRTGAKRWVAAAFVIAGTAGAVAVFVFASPTSILLRAALLALAFLLARYALSRDPHTLKDLQTPGEPVPEASRGALIMNLKSGGGKAERFHLEAECRARGIEPIVLRPEDDLLQLAHDAIDRGADVIGMAGGDGSQALVASVAAQRGIPMVVVPAGTRNHLALDLGLDRGDVAGALDAFGEAVEQLMDLAEVNGRVFVNNVSLGLYATIVRSPEYRDAKVDTTLAALPQVLGPDAQPFDLRFTGPDGKRHESAHLIQVSNDPYAQTLPGLGKRPRLDSGLLGILALEIPDDRAWRKFTRDLAAGQPGRYEGLVTWAAPSFEVTSGSPVAVGLDGESLELDPLLVFSSRPGALRVRLPKRAIGYSPAALVVTWKRVVPDLWQTALGNPVEIGT